MAERLSWWRRLFARTPREPHVPRPGPWPPVPPAPEITLDERADRFKRGTAVYEFLSDAARLQLAIDGDILRAASERRMR